MSRKLTARQRRTIEILLATPNITAAAEQAGVARQTLHRWLKDDLFLTALNEAEAQEFATLRRVLYMGKSSALATLHALMTGAQSEAVRRQAAADWITFILKLHELAIEARIARLEVLYEQKQF